MAQKTGMDRYAVIRTYGTKELHKWSQMNSISSKGYGSGVWNQGYGSPVRPGYGSGPYLHFELQPYNIYIYTHIIHIIIAEIGWNRGTHIFLDAFDTYFPQLKLHIRIKQDPTGLPNRILRRPAIRSKWWKLSPRLCIPEILLAEFRWRLQKWIHCQTSVFKHQPGNFQVMPKHWSITKMIQNDNLFLSSLLGTWCPIFKHPNRD